MIPTVVPTTCLWTFHHLWFDAEVWVGDPLVASLSWVSTLKCSIFLLSMIQYSNRFMIYQFSKIIESLHSEILSLSPMESIRSYSWILGRATTTGRCRRRTAERRKNLFVTPKRIGTDLMSPAENFEPGILHSWSFSFGDFRTELNEQIPNSMLHTTFHCFVGS